MCQIINVLFLVNQSYLVSTVAYKQDYQISLT